MIQSNIRVVVNLSDGLDVFTSSDFDKINIIMTRFNDLLDSTLELCNVVHNSKLLNIEFCSKKDIKGKLDFNINYDEIRVAVSDTLIKYNSEYILYNLIDAMATYLTIIYTNVKCKGIYDKTLISVYIRSVIIEVLMDYIQLYNKEHKTLQYMHQNKLSELDIINEIASYSHNTQLFLNMNNYKEYRNISNNIVNTIGIINNKIFNTKDTLSNTDIENIKAVVKQVRTGA